MTAITGTNNIRRFQKLAQLYAMRLELLGMRHSGGSVIARIKKHYGLKGNKQSIYDQFSKIVAKEEEI